MTRNSFCYPTASITAVSKVVRISIKILGKKFAEKFQHSGIQVRVFGERASLAYKGAFVFFKTQMLRCINPFRIDFSPRNEDVGFGFMQSCFLVTRSLPSRLLAQFEGASVVAQRLVRTYLTFSTITLITVHQSKVLKSHSLWSKEIAFVQDIAWLYAP